ncbi:hypothetical protein BIY26_09445 [Brenneria goodwinii]|uniref:Uncharacterized protein n=1 Tax=Brenneria goodwinii TaxID=1109412 RepID=A0AAE8ETD7_9GAMM|nr:hypothetical protein [Brenneria goodwinii]ATA23523.1 hypothetical protein AWC36_05065 [Brenneria goodwinii]RLM25232.1 hypothetical protein BIY26_09445 [Brenneria goodwinii]
MRLTVLDDDPGQKIRIGIDRYRVWLDDKEVRHCLTADDDKGEVISIVTDENGWMVAENGEVKRRTRYGQVRIEPWEN